MSSSSTLFLPSSGAGGVEGSREALFKTGSFRTTPNDRLSCDKPPTCHRQDSLSTLVTVTSASFLVSDERFRMMLLTCPASCPKLVHVTREVYWPCGFRLLPCHGDMSLSTKVLASV